MATVRDTSWIETPLQCKHPSGDRRLIIRGICHPFRKENGQNRLKKTRRLLQTEHDVHVLYCRTTGTFRKVVDCAHENRSRPRGSSRHLDMVCPCDMLG
jgi:hypothetical protein